MDNLLFKVLESTLNGIVALSSVRNEAGKIFDFEFIYINKAAENLLKEDREKLLSRRVSEAFNAIFDTPIFSQLISTVETGESKIVELEFKDDKINNWFKNSVVKLEDGVLISFIEIGEEKKKEFQLKEIEEVLTDTMEMSKIGSYEWNIPENRIYWSDELFKMYGYEPNEFLVTPDLHLTFIHPDDRNYIIDINRKLFKEPSQEFKYHYRFLRKDGSIGIGIGKGKSISQNGKMIRMRGYVQDISERTKTETLLSEAQEMGHIGSFELELEKNKITGTKEYYNIFNFDRTDISFEDVLYKIHPEDRHKISPEILFANKKEDTQFRIILDDGSTRYIWSKVKVYDDPSGKPVSVVGMVMDVTEITNAKINLEKLNKELEERIVERTKELSRSNRKLKKINEELDRFAYVISHDLKSPLNSIEGILLCLEKDTEKLIPQDSYQMLKMALERVSHMSGLIKELLKNARGESKSKEDVNVNELIQTLVASFKIPDSISVHVQPKLPTIFFHKISLIQIFQNLISNSIKYMDKKQGLIEIRYQKKNGECIFSVKDNGPGISPESQKKIFNLFETGDKQAHDESTGIGLSIIKKLIEEAKGYIWLESTPGMGSTFLFSLPSSVLTAKNQLH